MEHPRLHTSLMSILWHQTGEEEEKGDEKIFSLGFSNVCLQPSRVFT